MIDDKVRQLLSHDGELLAVTKSGKIYRQDEDKFGMWKQIHTAGINYVSEEK